MSVIRINPLERQGYGQDDSASEGTQRRRAAALWLGNAMTETGVVEFITSTLTEIKGSVTRLETVMRDELRDQAHGQAVLWDRQWKKNDTLSEEIAALKGGLWTARLLLGSGMGLAISLAGLILAFWKH